MAFIYLILWYASGVAAALAFFYVMNKGVLTLNDFGASLYLGITGLALIAAFAIGGIMHWFTKYGDTVIVDNSDDFKGK